MVRLPKLPARAVHIVRGLAVLAICLFGTFIAARIFDRYYPVKEWLIWRILPIWGYTLLFNAACVSGGAAGLRLLLGKRELPALEWLLYSMALGVVLFVLGLYLAGFSCAFRPWAAIVLPALMLGAGYRDVRRLWPALGRWRRAGPVLGLPARIAATLAIGWGVVSLAFLYLEAFDVSSLNFDAAWYHYPIAQDYARTHCIIPFPGEGHRAFPHLTSMLHTWALLVPGLKPLPLHWMLSLHLEYSLVVWRIVGVLAAALWMLRRSHVPGLWAVFFLFPSLFVYDQNIGGSADHVLGFFAAPMLLALMRTLRFFEWRWAALLGLLAGGHLLTKYQAVYMVVAIALTCFVRWAYLMLGALLRRRRVAPRMTKRRVRTLLIGPAVVIAVAAAVSAPHFVKNAVFYNNPVYPLAQGVFKSSKPKREPGVYQELPQPAAFKPAYSGLRRQLWALGHVFEYPFDTANRNFTKGRPYMGALFSLLLPCLLFVGRAGRIWCGAGVGVAAFLVWANTAPNDRYLLSFYDLFIAVAAALVVRVWQLGWIARAGLVPLVALQLFWGGDAMFYYGAQRLRSGLNLIAAGYDKNYDSKRFADFRAQRDITRATPPDAVIVGRNFKAHIGLDRTVLGDIRSSQNYINYSRLRDGRELWQHLKSRGATHLLYPQGDRLPPRWNNVVLFADLFRHARDVKQFGKLVLGKMPAAAPPPSAPLYVFMRRVRGYSDGLYTVEQLDIDGNAAKYFKPAPRPIAPLTDDNAVELLSRASAVVLGTGAGLRPDATAQLQRHFRSAEKWPSNELFMRR